ncbi:tail fiber domain-containing protein [Ferruginibacter lapsinanis]|uniref:tail fiber domain-containing protein n=1 Tax=Ferruginibacter lapsinanis TaxID=563172 RepID=UPI001E57FE23|nr:tail fiber domain-containing protein [Ferruginibacter lapsinanis]UEG49624.1 tail fiber domain-containing protein [Ferruginibacter lapsinanis]
MRKTLLLITILFSFGISNAQVGIGIASPNSSSMLDITSVNKGLLIPRMTSDQRKAIVSPARGLSVYDLTTKSHWYFDGSWKELATVANSDSGFVFMQGAVPSYNMTGGLLVSDSAGYIYDSGGPIGGYGNNENITMGINFPVGAQLCRIQIINLSTEALLDTLRIYNSTKSYTFSGNVTNQSIFFGFSYDPIYIQFGSNASATLPGFQIRFDHYFVNSTSTTNLTSTNTGFYYIPEKIAVRGGVQANDNWNKDSVGLNSFSFGNGNKANGNYGFAGGLNSYAQGTGSSAFGIETIARGFASTSIGMYNDPVLSNGETFTNSTSPLFIVGNGANNSNRSNALFIRRNGSVGIGTSNPDADAILDISSTTRGVLLPRMNLTQRNAMGVPATGMIIYQIDNTPGYYVYDGTNWVAFQDNLGNHTLTSNLITGTRYISKYGSSNLGIQMLDSGAVKINTDMDYTGFSAIPSERFRFDAWGGIIAKGILGVGAIPATGSGEKMMWHPQKAAFRAGSIGSSGTQWDESNIGYYTVAFGYNTRALGLSSIASGYQSEATGSYSTAIGYTCIGDGTGAVAIGYRCTADADYSVAIGQRASTNGHAGAMVFSDGSTTDSTQASANNQLSMRFAGGYRLFTNASMTVGVQIPAGGSSWSVISDVRKKENFVPASTDYFLTKLSTLNLGSWNYIGQDSKSFRHYGPMAQDIYAAFGKDKIGTIGCDTLLASADMDGIMMIMLKGLEKRSADQSIKIDKLEQQNAAIKKENEMLKQQLLKIDYLEAEIKKLVPGVK